MLTNEEEFRRLIASDYDLIASQGVALPTARLYDEAILRSLPENCKLVVDVGCGTGELAAILSVRADQVLGIDISEESIRIAKRRSPRLNVDYRVAGAEDLPSLVDRNACSAIIANRVLHHCANMPKMIAGLLGLLEPGGRLIILDLESTGRNQSFLRRLTLTALYCSAVLIKFIAKGQFLQALRDLRAEHNAYASAGWQRHLAHEPDYEWRDIQDALEAAGAGFKRRRVNWRFQFFVVETEMGEHRP